MSGEQHLLQTVNVTLPLMPAANGTTSVNSVYVHFSTADLADARFSGQALVGDIQLCEGKKPNTEGGRHLCVSCAWSHHVVRKVREMSG